MSVRRLGLTTRRELVRCGVTVGALGALARKIAARPDPAAALARTETDADVLATTLGFELLTAFVYQHVLGSVVRSERVRRVSSQLLVHEQAHARVLTARLTILGRTSPASPANIAEADQTLAALHVSGLLAELRTEQDGIRLLSGLERVAERVYYLAVAKLGDPELLRTAAEIMASEAQHATVLSELLHPGDVAGAVPDAFVQGRQ